MRLPIPFAIASNKSRSKAVNNTRLVNLFAESAPQDSKAPIVVYGTPGTMPLTMLPTAPVLGMLLMDERCYAVTKTKLYEVRKNGQYKELGDVNFSGRVSMATNGFQLVMVDGSNGYAFEHTKGMRDLSEVEAWYPANTVTYQDGYFIFNRKDTGQFFLSDLLSIQFDALKFATAEGAPDDANVVISKKRELWVFGPDSIEVWYNSGDPDFPFERMQGAFIDRGTRSPQSVVKLDDSVFFLGTDGMIYRTNGYQPIRVSTHAVENDISKGRVDDAFAFSYVDKGHSFYQITFPSQKKTWCFDVATGLWHERSHFQWGCHHANCHVYFANMHLVGDFQNGYIYHLTHDYYKDHNDTIRRVAISPTVHNGKQTLFQSELELDMQSGVGLTRGQGENPQAALRYSDDGGETWSNERKASIGKRGNYLTRVRWTRLGSFRQRMFEVVITDPVPVVIISAYAEVTSGRD